MSKSARRHWQPSEGVTRTHPLTVEELERWRLFGAHWRVLELSGSRAEVEMCTCTGEPVEWRRTEDASVIEYLRAADGG